MSQLRMRCNLRPPDAAPVHVLWLSRPCHAWTWSRSTFPLASLAFSLLIRYITLWPWTLTRWPWPLTFDLKQVQFWYFVTTVKLCSKFERNRTFHGEVIAIWIFDLLTLNMYLVLRYRLGLGDSLPKFKLSQAIRSWNVTIGDANTQWHTMTLSCDLLTFKIYGRFGVTWSESVVNLSEIEQSATELLTISHISVVQFQGWGTFSGLFSWVRGPIFTKLGEDIGRL